MERIWKDIPGYDGFYQVSDHGDVKSIPRDLFKIRLGKETRYRVKGCGLKQDPSRVYLHVKLQRGGQCASKSVHRLVLEAFIGPCPDGHEACHKNGDPRNNRLGNLYWGTASQNKQDSIRHGTHAYGERNGRARLTERDVLGIIDLLVRDEYTLREIGDIYNVASSTISSQL